MFADPARRGRCVNDVSAITQAGIAGFALFVLLMLVRLASNGTILFGTSVEKERAGWRERADADAKRIEFLEASITTLSSQQKDQMMPALRDSITAAVETNIVLKQMASELQQINKGAS